MPLWYGQVCVYILLMYLSSLNKVYIKKKRKRRLWKNEEDIFESSLPLKISRGHVMLY